MNKRHQKEATVDEAARLLAVSPRTIINYINTKQIEAIKVGKSWFIGLPSLEAFRQRYKLGTETTVIGRMEEESQENKNPGTEVTYEKSNQTEKKTNPVSTLRLFQMARETLHEMNSNDFFDKKDTALLSKFDNLKLEAIELIGAGFYSYDRSHFSRYVLLLP